MGQSSSKKHKKSIDDLAEKLVELYAQREVVDGFAFEPDDTFQMEFEEAFPYEETEDQLQASQEIKASMEQPHPMDRLLAVTLVLVKRKWLCALFLKR